MVTPCVQGNLAVATDTIGAANIGLPGKSVLVPVAMMMMVMVMIFVQCCTVC